MHQVDLRGDAKVEHAFERFIGMTPVPAVRRGLDAVPRHAVAGAGDAELRHQGEVIAPAAVMIRQLVLVERATRDGMPRCDEGVLYAGRPPEGTGPREFGKTGTAGKVHDFNPTPGPSCPRYRLRTQVPNRRGPEKVAAGDCGIGRWASENAGD
jgi:hypothetical protein